MAAAVAAPPWASLDPNTFTCIINEILMNALLTGRCEHMQYGVVLKIGS
jgi:hypothetical protein